MSGSSQNPVIAKELNDNTVSIPTEENALPSNPEALKKKNSMAAAAASKEDANKFARESSALTHQSSNILGGTNHDDTRTSLSAFSGIMEVHTGVHSQTYDNCWGYIKSSVSKFFVKDLEFYTEEEYSSNRSYFSSADNRQGSQTLGEVPFKFFPLKFKDPQIEKEFQEGAQKLLTSRLWIYSLVLLIGGVGCWISLPNLFVTSGVSDNLLLIHLYHAMVASYVATRIMLWGFSYWKILQPWLEVIIIIDILAYTTLFQAWTTAFAFYTSQKIVEDPVPVAEAILSGREITLAFADVRLQTITDVLKLTVVAITYLPTLLLNMALPSRTAITWSVHIYLPLMNMVPYFAVAVVLQRQGNISNNFLLTFLAFSIGAIAYFGRYCQEILQRTMFWAWLRTSRKLKVINESLQAKKGGAKTSTAVEELISMVKQSQAILSTLQLSIPGRNTEIYLKISQLDSLLERLLNTLTSTENLYSILLDESNIASDIQRQFLQLYAEDISKNIYPANLASLKNGDANLSAAQGGVKMEVSNLPQINQIYDTGEVETKEISAAGAGTTESQDKNLSNPIAKESNIMRGLYEGIGLTWDYDLLGADKEIKNLLIRAGFIMLFPLVQHWKCKLETLQSFLATVESKYLNNPYHNTVHAIMVAHCSACLMQHLGLKTMLGPVGQATMIVAALCHDMGHPGRNNMFFQNAVDPVAVVYNDISILENLHSALTFRIIQNPHWNIFFGVNSEEFRMIRQRIIELILSTDMKHHFEIISRFRIRRESSDFDMFKNEEDRWLTCRILIKGADLGHGTVIWDNHYEWSLRVIQEFYEQGDEEMRRGFKKSPLCDRDKHSEVAKSQCGFLEFVVAPLFKELIQIDHFGFIEKKPINNLNINISHWQGLSERKTEIPLADDFEETSSLITEGGTIPRRSRTMLDTTINFEEIFGLSILGPRRVPSAKS